MTIALLADIHGNREAMTACLADAERRHVDQLVFLGDLVGYGADPVWVVDRVGEHVERGALAILGNHDAAAAGAREDMNETAQEAIEWTRRQLDSTQKNFLGALPLSVEHEGRLFVHASPIEPSRWHYITGSQAARNNLVAMKTVQNFCGHVHIPALYGLSLTGKLMEFSPVAGTAIPLLPGRRWLAVIGAVGQPRDQNPAACYALLDDKTNTLTYRRVPYDVATAARKIRDAGLPAILATRLERGF
jgi:diadenosine tetraphosphatase ApaH/serine/threonine PP2A family protein phosphatase